jgi:hypothetical protein
MLNKWKSQDSQPETSSERNKSHHPQPDEEGEEHSHLDSNICALYRLWQVLLCFCPVRVLNGCDDPE